MVRDSYLNIKSFSTLKHTTPSNYDIYPFCLCQSHNTQHRLLGGEKEEVIEYNSKLFSQPRYTTFDIFGFFSMDQWEKTWNHRIPNSLVCFLTPTAFKMFIHFPPKSVKNVCHWYISIYSFSLCLNLEYGGEPGGQPCVFPFIYKKQTFYTCTNQDAQLGRFWCATTGNYDKDGQWSYCADTSRKMERIYIL